MNATGVEGSVVAFDGSFPTHILTQLVEQVAEKLRNDSSRAIGIDTDASPPPAAPLLSSDVLLSDEMVKALSQKMLQAGHLDVLKDRASSSRRVYRSSDCDPNMSAEEKLEVEEEIKAFKQHTTEVVKDLTTHLVSRDEISNMLDFEVVPVTPMQDDIFPGESDSVRLKSPALEPRSPVSRIVSRTHSNTAATRGAGGTGVDFGIKLKTVMEQQIQNLTANTVKKTEFENRMRNLETFINIEFSKANKEQKDLLGQTVMPLKDRTGKVERSVHDMGALLNSLEAMVREQTSDTRRYDNGGSAEDAWRPEIERINAALEASLQDQRNIAKAVSIDIKIYYIFVELM